MKTAPDHGPACFATSAFPATSAFRSASSKRSLEQGVDFYKYVFIDESHRFKGDSTQRYELLTRICQNKGVILVSATPYNNTLDDIYSQLKLFQPPRNSTIPGLRNLEAFFDTVAKASQGAASSR